MTDDEIKALAKQTYNVTMNSTREHEDIEAALHKVHRAGMERAAESLRGHTYVVHNGECWVTVDNAVALILAEAKGGKP